MKTLLPKTHQSNYSHTTPEKPEETKSDVGTKAAQSRKSQKRSNKYYTKKKRKQLETLEEIDVGEKG